jgi:hypothetical protein
MAEALALAAAAAAAALRSFYSAANRLPPAWGLCTASAIVTNTGGALAAKIDAPLHSAWRLARNTLSRAGTHWQSHEPSPAQPVPRSRTTRQTSRHAGLPSSRQQPERMPRSNRLGQRGDRPKRQPELHSESALRVTRRGPRPGRLRGRPPRQGHGGARGAGGGRGATGRKGSREGGG